MKIHGFSDSVLKVSAHYEKLKQAVPKAYQKIVEEHVKQVSQDAATNLAKPSWMLSSYIRSKSKLLKNGEIIFGVAEVQSKSGYPKNHPGTYARFHESGYYVDLDKVKKKKKNRIKKRKSKTTGQEYSYSYTKQKAKHFFKKAEKKNKSALLEKMKQANLTIERMLHK